MTDIPDDIMSAARKVVVEDLGMDSPGLLQTSYIDCIAEAILEERERSRQLLSEAEKREAEARTGWAFAEGDLVRKKSGSWWEGRVVGTYTTKQTPRGYAVQLDKPFGPVQIYPESALESALQSEER